MKVMHAGISTLTVILLLAGITGAVSGQYQKEDVSCFHCHSKQVTDFGRSVHYNNISCTGCHGGDIKLGGAAVSISAMYANFTGIPARANITIMCSKCHAPAASLYRESIHWKELEKGAAISATCTDCHGYHNILPVKDPNSSANPEIIPLTCAACHENQTRMQALYYGIQTDRYDTYKKSYHYKAYLGGGKVLATCSDCHENHDTRNESDPASAINPANLPATCGKPHCHPGANNVFIYGGKVHEGQSVYLWFIDAKKLVTYFYIIMILFELTFTFGLIFLGITSNFELRRRH